MNGKNILKDIEEYIDKNKEYTGCLLLSKKHIELDIRPLSETSKNEQNK